MTTVPFEFRVIST